MIDLRKTVMTLTPDNMREVLYDIRSFCGPTFTDMAKLSGVHAHTIGSWVRGDSSPKFELLYRVLDAVGYKLQTAKNDIRVDITPDNFTQVFRDLRRDSGLSILKLSSISGLTETTIDSWSHGDHLPVIKPLCYALDAMGYKLLVVKKGV